MIVRMDSHIQQLIDCGLSRHQASIYELLVKNGTLRASTIVRQLGNTLSRPLVYHVLGELTELGLVEKTGTEKDITRFSPAHPAKLQEIAEQKQKEADRMSDAASVVIPRIVSEYNLVTSKPGVRFFEGTQGIEAVLADSLTARTPIYSYTDVEQIEKFYKDIVDAYVRERERRKILKKLILDDTPFVRNFYAGVEETQSEVRLIPKSVNPFTVAVQIYDDKVSYLTLSPGREMAIIIQNEEIAGMERHLFESLYNSATPLYTPSSSSSSSNDSVA